MTIRLRVLTRSGRIRKTGRPCTQAPKPVMASAGLCGDLTRKATSTSKVVVQHSAASQQLTCLIMLSACSCSWQPRAAAVLRGVALFQYGLEGSFQGGPSAGI